MTWRIGEHYGIHVYDGDRPVATFHRAEDAAVAVEIVNAPLLPASPQKSLTQTLAAHQPYISEDAYGSLYMGCLCGWAGPGNVDLTEWYEVHAAHQAEQLTEST